MADAPAPETAAVTPAKQAVLIPILVAVFVGLGAGGASGAFVTGPMLAKRVIPPVDTASLARQLEAGGHPDSVAAHEAAAHEEEAPKAKGEGKDGEAAAPAPMHLLDNIVMNPSGSGGQRFLLLSVAYELADAAAVEKIKQRDAEVRDLVQRVVGMRTIEQLGDLPQRDVLKAEVAKATESVIGAKAVKKVFFPQFVIQ
jgi:flagellar basal body-associated protein FliL